MMVMTARVIILAVAMGLGKPRIVGKLLDLVVPKLVEQCEEGVPGVLTIVAAALVLAEYVWPSVCNEHTMLHFWHALEYVGNTIM